MKALAWVGSSKQDLLCFPKEVRQEIGFALYAVQKGEFPSNIKPLRGLGTGCYEVVSNCNTNTYRAAYIVNLGEKIYVLHCFKKKSHRGIKTPKQEINLIERRLVVVRQVENED